MSHTCFLGLYALPFCNNAKSSSTRDSRTAATYRYDVLFTDDTLLSMLFVLHENSFFSSFTVGVGWKPSLSVVFALTNLGKSGAACSDSLTYLVSAEISDKEDTIFIGWLCIVIFCFSFLCSNSTLQTTVNVLGRFSGLELHLQCSPVGFAFYSLESAFTAWYLLPHGVLCWTRVPTVEVAIESAVRKHAIFFEATWKLINQAWWWISFLQGMAQPMAQPISQRGPLSALSIVSSSFCCASRNEILIVLSVHFVRF